MKFLDQLRARAQELVAERQAAKAKLDSTLATAEERGDGTLTADEQAAFDAARDEVRRLDSEIEAAEARIAELVAIEARQHKAIVAAPAPQGGARVTNEARTYDKGSPRSFFSDAYAARYLGDPGALEAIARHTQEMRVDGRLSGAEFRDTTTSAFAGLVVPQYLTDLFAPVMRAGRPTANVVRSVPLPPSGTSFVIPRGTTATTTAEQSENASLSETDYAVTNLTVTMTTIAGLNDVSRQSVERGENIDQILFGDLAADYALQLDAYVLNKASIGLLNVSGINAVTYTDASPTVPELFPKLADAIQQINSNRYMPASVIVMHPRRWGWITAAIDTQNRPLFVPYGPSGGTPVNAVGVGQAAEYGQVVGMLMGLPVVTDANIPTNLGAGTNEDRIIVMRADDPILWEDPAAPLRLKFEETLAGNLTVRLVVYGFVAFTGARYPKAISVISGTGLVTPTF